MAMKHDTHKNIELRRVITSSAFTMIMLVAVIGLFSLFSIWSINRAWLAGIDETASLQALSRASLDAQVSFKIQVQEWKNILLRGDNPALLEKHLASFRDSGTVTTNNLVRVADTARSLGFSQQADAASAIAQTHQSLAARYETLLSDSRNGAAVISQEAAHTLDVTVRGADRDLDRSIGSLAIDIATLSEQRRSVLADKMQQRYQTLRWFIIGVIGLSLVITGYAVTRAIRATRR